MKNRPRDKKAGIIILAVLFIISLADVILRATTLENIASTAANHGEVFMTAILSLLLIIFALKGKDRIFYILSGAWLGYFAFNQLFDLPEIISMFFGAMKNYDGFTDFAILFHVLSMVCIIAIGALLVEYMNDGTIYNKAFNILCTITILTFVVNIVLGIYDIVVLNDISAVLAILNNLSRAAMVFFFTFFAYDSAKMQLEKTKLAK